MSRVVASHISFYPDRFDSKIYKTLTVIYFVMIVHFLNRLMYSENDSKHHMQSIFVFGEFVLPNDFE